MTSLWGWGRPIGSAHGKAWMGNADSGSGGVVLLLMRGFPTM
jgi:hypothetical protein